MPISGSSSSVANKDMMTKLWINGDQLSTSVENIVGKGKIARDMQFLLFPQCFQKQSFVDVFLWSKGLTLYLICQFQVLPIQQQIKMMSKTWTKGVQLSDWKENIVGKEEIACYEQFLLFPQCF